MRSSRQSPRPSSSPPRQSPRPSPPPRQSPHRLDTSTVYSELLKYSTLPVLSRAQQTQNDDQYNWRLRLVHHGYEVDLLPPTTNYRSIYRRLNRHKFNPILTYQEACREGDRDTQLLLQDLVPEASQLDCANSTHNLEIVRSVPLSVSQLNQALLNSLDEPDKLEVLLDKVANSNDVLALALLSENVPERSLVLLIRKANDLEVISEAAGRAKTTVVGQAFEELGYEYSKDLAASLGLERSFRKWLGGSGMGATRPRSELQQQLRLLITNDRYYHPSLAPLLLDRLRSTPEESSVYRLLSVKHNRKELVSLLLPQDQASLVLLTEQAVKLNRLEVLALLVKKLDEVQLKRALRMTQAQHQVDSYNLVLQQLTVLRLR